MNLVLGCITERYAQFSGRAQRMEYWSFTLVSFVVQIGVVSIVSSRIFGDLFTFIMFIVFFGLLIPHAAVGVRRLHDTNRSGWWILIPLIPLIGGIWFIVLCCFKGDEGENQFGPDPLSAFHNSA